MAQIVQRTRPNFPTGRASSSASRSNATIPLLESVRLLYKVVSQIARNFGGLILFYLVFNDKLGQEGTIHASRHIMPPRNRKKRPRFVFETHCIVKARGFVYVCSKTQNPSRPVVNPPRRAKPQAR